MKLTIIDNHKKKTSKLLAELKKEFDVWSYWDDEELDKLFLPPKKTTTRTFELEQESNVMKGSPWNEINKKHGDGMMTLREYAIAFSLYFKETGKYLDEVGWTYLRDSLPGGGVADGYWYPHDRRVEFHWYYAGNRDSGGGARVAISPDSLNLVPSATLESRVEKLEADMDKIRKFLII
jgi:hypothetical protein